MTLASYWLEDLSSKTLCPDDYRPLEKFMHRCGGVLRDGLKCAKCDTMFIQYTGAEDAVELDNIRCKYLSQREKKAIERIRKEIALEKKKEEDEEKRNLETQKKEFISKIIAAFESNYLYSETIYEADRRRQLLPYEEFKKLQRDFIKNWFIQNKEKGGCLPDEDQCAAIGATKKNVEVVARAGSGKTSTIVNRFRFLTDHCGVEPSSVLMLAFNRKAANELHDKIERLLSTQRERTTNMPHVMTFHALAYSIVHPQEELIYDDEESGTLTLSRTVQAIIDEKLRDLRWVSMIREVMLSHFKWNWETIESGGYHLTKEEQLLYRRSIPNQTLKGEYVKSYGEKVIANILFENDVEYRYEKAIYWDGEVYRPDFTIAAANKKVIIEYFGLVGDPAYDRQIEQKRAFWRSKNTPLLEVYPQDVSSGLDVLSEELVDAFEKLGIPYRHLSEDEIWQKIKDRAIDTFTKAMKSFIGRCRKKDLSAADLSSMIQSYSSELPTENMFLQIAEEIYKEYLDKIRREGLEDFDGLISRAIARIQSGNTGFDKRDRRGDLKDLSFIMIDEYQDFSFLFDKFLGAIRSVCPSASIFCVGDDWQAINAFAGSDVQYFKKFSQRHAGAIEYQLRTNYRSQSEIVEVGTKLMSRNQQIKAFRESGGTVQVCYLTDFIPNMAEQTVHETDRFTPAVLRLVSNILDQDQGKRVVFLTRANDRLPQRFNNRGNTVGTAQERFLATIQSFFPPEERDLITASTTHKYKGKEEDAVIILDALVGFYPLIHPSWIFQRVFGDTVDKLVEEEKRLFYVALSRAKTKLYIVTSEDDESPFLKSIGDVPSLRWNELSSVRPNELGIKIEIYNQPGYGSTPTYSIKDLLNKDQYRWYSGRKCWYRYCRRRDFDICAILEQDWAKQADHVLLIQYDEDDQMEKSYLLEAGIPPIPLAVCDSNDKKATGL